MWNFASRTEKDAFRFRWRRSRLKTPPKKMGVFFFSDGALWCRSKVLAVARVKAVAASAATVSQMREMGLTSLGKRNNVERRIIDPKTHRLVAGRISSYMDNLICHCLDESQFRRQTSPLCRLFFFFNYYCYYFLPTRGRRASPVFWVFFFFQAS